jgi:hypothetical protein
MHTIAVPQPQGVAPGAICMRFDERIAILLRTDAQ